MGIHLANLLILNLPHKIFGAFFPLIFQQFDLADGKNHKIWQSI